MPSNRVERVAPHSPARRAGIAPGDHITAINGERVRDVIDYMYHRSDESLDISLTRAGRERTVHIEPREGEDPGLELEQFPIKPCRNKCVFCFMKQLPRGMRRTLYIRDDDYRMSFLYGNFITLTNLSDADRKRIIEQRLSPMYISVHATGNRVRNKLLGALDAPDVMKELRFLKRNRIRMHTQIVLCPGYNDGKVLMKTLRDLTSMHPWVMTAAVVPVGLTKFHREGLVPFTSEDAVEALGAVAYYQKLMMERVGEPVVYGSDELYLKAGIPLPDVAEYGELSQIENGVGLVPDFLARARAVRLRPISKGKRYLTFTGVSFHPFLDAFIKRINKRGADIMSVPVANGFFGPLVTVAGLLVGKDVVNALRPHVKGRDELLVPDVVLREGAECFLDDMTVKELSKALHIKCRLVEASPEGLVSAIYGGGK